jgi:hypothetical protein
VFFTIGPYALKLPDTAAFPASSERLAPHRVLPLFRIGPFNLSATLENGSLADWREHVDWTTKYQANILTIEVNGVPGLMLPPTDRRLDYVFHGAARQRLSIVAWSDSPTTLLQRNLVQESVFTIHLRQTILA